MSQVEKLSVNGEQIDNYQQAEINILQALPQVNDTHLIGDFLLQCVSVGRDYVTVWDVSKDDSLLGEIRMGWDSFWTHTMSFGTFATPQEAVIDLYESLQALLKKQQQDDELITFEKVGDGIWEETVNGVNVRITAVLGGYKTNVTDDVVLTNFAVAIKQSLVAVTKIQEKQLLERIERANTIEVLEQNGDEFVVENSENGNHYVVHPNHPEVNQRCECADCHYRGAKCKHQIAVENFLSSEFLVATSFDDLLDEPFDELTAQDWERIKEPELGLLARWHSLSKRSSPQGIFPVADFAA
ncbi:MAG: hypothetical protein V7L04_14015 [Nostoc sp.]|uniref:hypothetical protein n=1 Tax=Nostoc sp. TaxID=1180 RepID=UPI002FF4FF6A